MTKTEAIGSWKEILRFLASFDPESDIKQIVNANVNNLREQCYQGLIIWKNEDCKSNPPLKTLETLQKALKEQKMVLVAGKPTERMAAVSICVLKQEPRMKTSTFTLKHINVLDFFSEKVEVYIRRCKNDLVG